jgi:2-iminobutanoate/2-iminopropanoate deaminase
MKIIHTMKAPAAIGPYSQATVRNGFLFTSMMIGINPGTGKLTESFEQQTEQIMLNLQGILEMAGMGFSMVLRTTVYLTDISRYAVFNEIYSRYFREEFPAREVVEVSALPGGALAGVSLIASS